MLKDTRYIEHLESQNQECDAERREEHEKQRLSIATHLSFIVILHAKQEELSLERAYSTINMLKESVQLLQKDHPN